MKEIYEVNDNLFSTMIIVDVVCANIWMAFLLYGANITDRVDGWLKSDVSAIDSLKKKVEDYRASVEKMPTTLDMYKIAAIAFGGVALSHWGADVVVPLLEKHSAVIEDMRLNSLLSKFFWMIVIALSLIHI